MLCSWRPFAWVNLVPRRWVVIVLKTFFAIVTICTVMYTDNDVMTKARLCILVFNPYWLKIKIKSVTDQKRENLIKRICCWAEVPLAVTAIGARISNMFP